MVHAGRAAGCLGGGSLGLGLGNLARPLGQDGADCSGHAIAAGAIRDLLRLEADIRDQNKKQIELAVLGVPGQTPGGARDP